MIMGISVIQRSEIRYRGPEWRGGTASYPHYFGARDWSLHINQVNIGDAQRGSLMVYPLRPTSADSPDAWNENEDPKVDRVVFDIRGEFSLIKGDS